MDAPLSTRRPPHTLPPTRRRFLGLLVFTLSLGLLAGVSFYAGYASARLNGPVTLPVPGADAGPAPQRTGALTVVAEAWRIVDAEFYDRTRLDPTRLTYGAIKGLLEALDDPYTAVADRQRT